MIIKFLVLVNLIKLRFTEIADNIRNGHIDCSDSIKKFVSREEEIRNSLLDVSGMNDHIVCLSISWRVALVPFPAFLLAFTCLPWCLARKLNLKWA